MFLSAAVFCGRITSCHGSGSEVLPVKECHKTSAIRSDICLPSVSKMTLSRIARILAIEEIFTTRSIVRCQKTGSVKGFPKSGPTKGDPESHYSYIDEAVTTEMPRLRDC